jgi:TPR repeat protein
MFHLATLYVQTQKDYRKAETYYRLAAEAGHTLAMEHLGEVYHYGLQEYKNAEKYYQMAAERRDLDALVNLAFLYHNELHAPKQAERYYTIAAEQGDLRAMNGLAWLYFEQKREREKSLHYAQQTLKQERNIYTAHTAACIYLWNDQPDAALQLADEFMTSPQAYETLEHDILLYLMLLLAKGHYQQIAAYCASVEVAERFKPLYYALLYFTHDPGYQKLPPELSEPVTDIIRQINQLARDYC